MAVTTETPAVVPADVSPSSVVSTEPAQRRFTVEEYHKMIDAGIFDGDERVELLDGVVFVVTRQGPSHAFVIERLNAALVQQLAGRFAIRPQLPLTLLPESEPIPDLAVVNVGAATREHHPSTALLAIEVSDTTLRKDRTLKAAIYAEAGIPEYWIINVKNESIEVYRDPDPAASRYRTMVTLTSGQVLTPSSIPGFSLPVADLFA
jgi:Uma2 family endonuclease